MDPAVAELCSFCNGLLPLKEESSQGRAHHPTLGLLENSSLKCSVCKVMLGDWSLEKSRKRWPAIDKLEYDSIAIKVKLREIQASRGLSWAMLEVHLDARGFNFLDPFSISTCNKNSISAALPIWKAATTSIPEKAWLQDCELQHERCKPLAGDMPKRLIDVGSRGGLPPRLVKSHCLQEQCTPNIRYATLSYCWGGAKFCTTKKKVESYEQEIPYELLPSTLQDAITLARHLDIRYIWIDALCIVQDDDIEWGIEASKMRDIYSGSSITIAASDAANGSMGCFPLKPDDDCSLNHPSAFVTVKNSGDGDGIIIRVQPSDIRALAGESVLNTRGWVLQEMVLSNRTVHCMKSGLYWECRSECRTEIGISFDRSTSKNSSIPILRDDPQNEANRTWWKWIESYSRRRFSFPRDRLPALSGIVRHYQRATKDTLVLGLWERSFNQDLLWMRIDKLVEGVDPTSNYLSNIPSWTWLSCPHEVWFDFPNYRTGSNEDRLHEIRDHIKLVEWAVDWTSEPLISDVKFTRLILDGPTAEFVLSVSSKGKDHNPPYFDVGDEKPDFQKGPFPWRCAGQFDDKLRTPPTKYLCMLVRSRIYNDKASMRETFLILEPCSDSSVYRRIGIGIFIGESPNFDSTARRTLSLV
ncbi:hypothetical protein LSUB1_G008233 [Lachnellula subtilissima]|uniref:Heterokaryon incompatibility domain-containing protein n=1 Tax=Lachnellula subtilissima TaxID=602034 RepID=A0A8H8RMF4_9HELO|nr:hypothetical protein LSUB1_G008233 [Lachnellula subtilissima]